MTVWYVVARHEGHFHSYPQVNVILSRGRGPKVK